MSAIDHFDLRSFDLNLLVAFDALMEERSVTRAAARLRVQQPAMSHNLALLRMLLRDELFVRTGQTMRPTVRARALAPRIRDTLRQVQDALRRQDDFDPRTQERTFRLGFSSEMEVLVLADLTARLRREAPRIRLLGRPVSREEVHRLLDEAQLDLAIGCFEPAGTRHCAAPLSEQSLACCFNPRLLALRSPVGLKEYVTTEHALVTLTDSLHGCLTEALARARKQLNVVMASSDFLSVFSAAMQGPVLATMPARMVRRYAPAFGLEVSPVPLPLRLTPVAAVWSAQLDRDPGLVWLRAQVDAVLAAHESAGAGRMPRRTKQAAAKPGGSTGKQALARRT